MSHVRRNVVANFAGKGWITVMNLAFVPLYIKYLGMEAYGLIGFNATLMAMFSLLDLGLSTTINREIAKWSAEPSEAQEARNLVRTLEVVYWASALLIAIITFALAPLIAHHWVKVKELSPDAVVNAVRMMGFSIALQWPSALYSGGLQGLQRQVLLNAAQVGAATIRGGGVVLALMWLGPHLSVFFGWTMAANALMTLLLGLALWNVLPKTARVSRFDVEIIRRVGKFAAGMSGISVASLVLMQMDKVVLSTALPMAQFGYYSLAATVASVMLQLVGPITSALFPRLVQAASKEDDWTLAQLYHRSCQAVAVAVAPVAITIAVFAWELLFVWTGKTIVADNASKPLTLLALGFGLNALMNMPYLLQLSFGWAKLAFWQNIVSIIVLFPLLLWMVKQYGAVGAAAVWLLLNVGYVLLTVPIMHRRLLPGQAKEWYSEDVGMPVAAALVVALIGHMALNGQMSRPALLVGIGIVWAGAAGAAAMVAPHIRKTVLRMFGGKQWARQG